MASKRSLARRISGLLFGVILLALVWLLDSAGEDTRQLEDLMP